MISIIHERIFELHIFVFIMRLREDYGLVWKREEVMVPAGRAERVMFIPGRGVAERRIGGGRRDWRCCFGGMMFNKMEGRSNGGDNNIHQRERINGWNRMRGYAEVEGR